MADANRPNILWLLSDEHSFRFMNHHHEHAETVQTPNFDRLASQGTVFANAYCQMPLCTPSRMCMLTGQQQGDCGAWDNGSVIAPDMTTMPKTFAAAGYATCLVGKMHFGGNLQFHGFQHRPYGDLAGTCGHQWEPLATRGGNGMRSRTVDAGVTEIPESQLQDCVVASESVAWIREQRGANPDQPWLLCASFSRPHFPLTAPKRWVDYYLNGRTSQPFVGKTGDAYDHPMSAGMRKGFRADDVEPDENMHARACYFACVSYLDEVIGDLLARLEATGELDNTVIVYTSDHGEMAGEHGVWYKQSWHEASAHVPLIMSTPAQRRGESATTRVTTPVSLADLYPTYCGFAGIDQPAGLAGVDLSPVVSAGAEAPDRPIVCDNLTKRWGAGTEFRMVRQGDYKYVRFRDCEPLLFDLAADPQEQTNLAANPPADAAALVAASEVDFAHYESRRPLDGELRQQYTKSFPDHILNCFMLKDGTVIGGDTFLYDQQIVGTPDTFGDHPLKGG